METTVIPSPRTRRPKRRKRWVPWVLLISLIIVIGIPGLKWYLESMPNDTQVKPHPDVAVPVIFEGKYLASSALIEQGEIYLPLEMIRATFDSNMIWDEQSQSVIITTENHVLQFPTDQLTASINQKPFELRMPVKKVEENIYVPADPLKEIYPISITEAGGVVELLPYNTAKQKGKIIVSTKNKEGVFVRAGNSIKEPYYIALTEGDVTVLGESDGWYHIQTAANIIGYVEKKHIQITNIETNKHEMPNKTHVPWKPIGNKINLTWEHVSRNNPDTNKLPAMDGVNVVSPTWFEIIDNDGNVENRADKKYVDWAHKRGYQVWALFSNGFEPDRTKEVLKSFDSRQHIINQVVSYAKLYGLDGINVDFENIYLDDKDLVVQFLREMTPYLHELNLVVSADVTVKSSSEMWSLFYDRKRIGEVVDYVALMTYDEYWASSPEAGSVASLPWTERGLKGLLEEVPAHKVLLGVPFYTRVWEEAKTDTGEIKVTSKAIGMDRAQSIIKEKNLTVMVDEASGQHYVEYSDAGKKYRLWLEDELSMRKRIQLMKKYDIAGIASWQRAFASDSIWNVMKDEFEKRLNKE